jgi:DNA repair exonuclease SbcCD ATPase subunit
VLFDLQSPRRRRVIRVSFALLAAIFAISFVFLGVGTGGGGFSISDLFGSGGGSSSSSAFDDDIQAAQQRLEANPKDTAALVELIQLHYQAGSQDVNSDGTLTSDGEQELRQSADAWNKYVKLTKGQIDRSAAIFALNTFDQLGSVDFGKARTDTSTSEALTDITAAVDDWKSAAQAQQALIDAQPNKNASSSYGRLAYYLYLSGQQQAADAAKAKSSGSKGTNASQIESQLKQVQQLGQQLQAAIKQLTKQQQQTQGAGAPGGATGGGNPLNGLGTGGSVGGTGF